MPSRGLRHPLDTRLECHELGGEPHAVVFCSQSEGYFGQQRSRFQGLEADSEGHQTGLAADLERRRHPGGISPCFHHEKIDARSHQLHPKSGWKQARLDVVASRARNPVRPKEAGPQPLDLGKVCQEGRIRYRLGIEHPGGEIGFLGPDCALTPGYFQAG